MNPHKYSDVITSTVEQLSEYESFKTLCHLHHDGEPMPQKKFYTKLSNCAGL